MPPLWLSFLKIRSEGDGLVSDFTSVQRLLDYLWYRNSGSKQSVKTYSFHLVRFCRWAKASPDELVNKERTELEKQMKKYLNELRRRSKERGASARYVNLALMCLKTFFRVNDFNKESNLELRLKNYPQPPRTRNRTEYVPRKSEAKRMAERAKGKRNRGIIYTLYSTGLRNAALRALNVGDIRKELEEERENLLIKVEPEWNKRVPGACKNCIPYYTFTSSQATQAIKEMLEERRGRFGTIRDDEPLFLSRGSRLEKKTRLSARELQEIVKNAAKEANIKEWKHVTPHSLRKVFESVLRAPLKDGGRMDGKDQEFLMGHILPGVQEHYYDWTKIDTLRSEFSKLMFEDKEPPELEDLKMYRKMAKIFGINPDDVKRRSKEELNRVLSWEEEKKALEEQIRARLRYLKEDVKEQKVISKEELQKYLQNKWRFLGTIDSQHVIVEKVSVEPIAINSILPIQTGGQDASEDNVIKQPTATDDAQASSNVSLQKEKLQDSSKSLTPERSVVNYLALSDQPIEHDNENSQASRKKGDQVGLQKWISSLGVKNLQCEMEIVSHFPANVTANEKKNVVQNSATNAKQKSLLSFIVQ